MTRKGIPSLPVLLLPRSKVDQKVPTKAKEASKGFLLALLEMCHGLGLPWEKSAYCPQEAVSRHNLPCPDCLRVTAWDSDPQGSIRKSYLLKCG